MLLRNKASNHTQSSTRHCGNTYGISAHRQSQERFITDRKCFTHLDVTMSVNPNRWAQEQERVSAASACKKQGLQVNLTCWVLTQISMARWPSESDVSLPKHMIVNILFSRRPGGKPETINTLPSVLQTIITTRDRKKLQGHKPHYIFRREKG